MTNLKDALLAMSLDDLADVLQFHVQQVFQLSGLTTAERRALGGHRFRDSDHVARLVSWALTERPQFFRNVPFTGRSIDQRTTRLTGLRMLEKALGHLHRLVADTRLREEAERNQLLLSVIKHADHLNDDPYCDPAEAQLRSSAVSEAKRILALHYHGKRKKPGLGGKAAMEGKIKPWKQKRRKLMSLIFPPACAELTGSPPATALLPGTDPDRAEDRTSDNGIKSTNAD